MHRLWLVGFGVVCCLCMRGVLTEPPRIVSTKYTERTFSLLDTEYETVVLTAEFDQPLYHVLCYHCLPRPHCANETKQGVLIEGDEPGIISLPVGATILNQHVSRGRFVYYKIQFSEEEHRCENLHLEFRLEYGDPDVYVTTGRDGSLPTVEEYTWSSVLYGPENIVLCSSDTAFEYGTFYVGVFGYNTTLFHITTQVFSYEPGIVLSTCDVPTNQTCVKDHDPLIETVEEDEWAFYSVVIDPFPPDTCKWAVVDVRPNEGDEGDPDLLLTPYSVLEEFEDWLYIDSDYWYYGSLRYGADSVRFLTCHERTEYIIAVYGFRTTEFRLTVLTEESSARCHATSLTDAGIADSAYRTNGGMALWCPDSEFPYYCEDWGDDSCIHLWAIAATDSPSPLVPFNPRMDPAWDLPFDFHDIVHTETVLSNKIAATVLISRTQRNERIIYAEIEDFSLCELVLSDDIGNVNSEPIADAIIGFVKQEPTCSYNELKHVTEVINEVTEKTEYASYSDFMEDRLKVAGLVISDAWQSCKAFANSFLSFETVGALRRSHFCVWSNPNSDEYLNDPCCNLALSFEYCCLQGNYGFPVTTAADLVKENVEARCSSPTCATHLLQDFSFQVNLVPDLDVGCSANLERTTSLSLWADEIAFYVHCKTQAFEEQRCVTDLDCLSRCNLLTHTCFFPEEPATYHFVACLLREMGVSVKVEFAKTYESFIAPGASDERALVNAVMQSCEASLCSGPLARFYNGYWLYEKVLSECEDECIPPICDDLSCEIPPDCRVPFSSFDWPCQRQWIFTEQNGSIGCESTKVCNYDIEDYLCSGDGYFCGLCSGNVCQEYPSFNETECAVGMCTTADFDEFLTAEECHARGRCEKDCSGVPCTTAAECTAHGDFCDDLYMYQKIEELTGENRDGICLGTPIVDIGGMPHCEENYLFYGIGCIALSIYDEGGCATLANETQRHVVWYERGYTSEQCASYPNICLHYEGEPMEHVSLQTHIPLDCVSCGGKIVPSFNWRAPVWVSEGELIPLEWRRREWVSVNTFGPTLNFDLLYRNIHQSLERVFLSLFSIEPICRYTRLGNYMRTIVCDCSEDGDENCYSSQTGLKIPVAYERVCSGSLSVIRGFPAEVSFESSTLPQAGDCVIVEVYIFPAVALFRASHRELSSDLFAGRQPTRTELVKNDEDVVVGELVGDGAEIVLGGDAAINANAPIRLCVTWKTTTDYNFAKYPVLDFARRRSPTSETLVPLGMRVTDKGNGQTFCTDVVTGGEYFPIIRQENWASTRRFSSVEEGLLGTTAALFFFLFLVTSLVLYRNLMAREKEPILSLRVILNGLLLLFALVRGIYLSLVVSGDDSDPPLLIRYFLIELPTLLFFCVFALVIFTWANIGGRISNRPMARLPKPFLYTMALVGFTFILCVFLFHLLPEGKTELTCAAESDGGSDGSSRDSITKFYQIFIASLAILMCGGALFYGQQVVRSLRQMQSVSAMNQRKRQLKRVSVIALVCAGGFLFHSTLQLVNVFGGEISVAVVFIYMLFGEFCTSLVLLLGTMKSTPKRSRRHAEESGKLQRIVSWVTKRANVVDVDSEDLASSTGTSRPTEVHSVSSMDRILAPAFREERASTGIELTTFQAPGRLESTSDVSMDLSSSFPRKPSSQLGCVTETE